MKDNSIQPEYSKLAEIYDTLMENVDYDIWADFIDEIIQVHHPRPESVLELACGTGSLSLSLDKLMCYEIMGTDKSLHMIQKARQKKEKQNSRVDFRKMDFLNIELSRTFDVVVAIFDSINYLHKPTYIKQLLNQVKKVIDSRSLFVYDFTTPKNSLQSIKYLDKERGHTPGNYQYYRTSRYDSEEQIHHNNFMIEKVADDGETVIEQYTEHHRQRIYTLKQMVNIIGETDFEIVAKYDAFDLIEATDNSLRITMVLRCPTIQ